MAGTAQFTVREAEYVSASRANFRVQLRTWRTWRRLLLLALGAGTFVGLLALALSLAWIEALTVGAASGGAGLLAVPVGMGVNYLLLPRRMGRLYRQQRALQQEQHVDWSDAGLRASGAGFTTDVPWSDYHGWHEARAEFLLYVNEQMPQFIPRNALDSVQVADLRATLVAYGPPRR